MGPQASWHSAVLMAVLPACFLGAASQNSLCIGKRHTDGVGTANFLACNDRNPKTDGECAPAALCPPRTRTVPFRFLPCSCSTSTRPRALAGDHCHEGFCGGMREYSVSLMS